MMFTTQDHWKFFAEFCKWELASGGPDPQLAIVNGLAGNSSQLERVWRAGCYIAVYNCGYAEALWRTWPWLKIHNIPPEELHAQLQFHWSKITTRVERRCVRRADWMAEFLIGYRKFAQGFVELRRECSALPPTQAYELAWNRALLVPRLGRYVALKLLEYLRRYEDLKIEAPDIRPKGGWSPRSTLATLWDRPDVAVESDRPEVLALVNELCTRTLARLAEDHDIKLDLFQLQVMLCEYRESWEGERQYPGRSLDSELKYGLKAEKDWDYKSGLWAVRKKLFPHEHLGEIQGWEGPREGPARALAHERFTWSDLIYNYHESYPEGEVLPKKKKKTKRAKSLNIYTIIEGKLYQSGRWTEADTKVCEDTVQKYRLTGIANFWKEDPRLKDLLPWYRWWPLQDGRKIADEVPYLADEIVKQLRSGGCILTMCYGGRNRSGLLSALVAQRWYGCNGAKAVEIVKQARKGALVNPDFVNYIKTSVVVPRVAG